MRASGSALVAVALAVVLIVSGVALAASAATTTSHAFHTNRDAAYYAQQEGGGQGKGEQEAAEAAARRRAEEEAAARAAAAKRKAEEEQPAKQVSVPPPVLGRSANAQTVSGEVLIELPGTHKFVPLRSLTSIPLGTVIDTTHGTVQLTSATNAAGGTETGQFHGGVFQLTQTSSRSAVKHGQLVNITVLSLAGPTPGPCAANSHRARLSKQNPPRRLWGDAHGNFRTVGRTAAATVRGTEWLTEDTCSGTLVRVTRGIVSVENLHTHRTVLVHAGKSTLVR